jgi:hypothetical protein
MMEWYSKFSMEAVYHLRRLHFSILIKNSH